MEAGKTKPSPSPIIQAIRDAEHGSTGVIRVHLSKKWIETDPFRRAARIFNLHQMTRTSQRNAVLIYVNLRRRKFAIVGDLGLQKAIGQRDWEVLTKELEENLRATQSEKAISLAVTSVGEILKKFFPAEP